MSFWYVYSTSRWPEDKGESYRVGVYRDKRDAEKAMLQWPDWECWVVEGDDE